MIENKIDPVWIAEAVRIIAGGIAERLTRGDVTVYRCGTIIRVDIKGVFEV